MQTCSVWKNLFQYQIWPRKGLKKLFSVANLQISVSEVITNGVLKLHLAFTPNCRVLPYLLPGTIYSLNKLEQVFTTIWIMLQLCIDYLFSLYFWEYLKCIFHWATRRYSYHSKDEPQYWLVERYKLNINCQWKKTFEELPWPYQNCLSSIM